MTIVILIRFFLLESALEDFDGSNFLWFVLLDIFLREACFLVSGFFSKGRWGLIFTVSWGGCRCLSEIHTEVPSLFPCFLRRDLRIETSNGCPTHGKNRLFGTSPQMGRGQKIW